MLPTFLDNMSWAMAEVYGAVSDKILINLARYFPYAHLDREVRNLFNYQARMLAQLGQVNKETIQIIAEGLGGADAALKQSLEAAILEALKDDEPELRKAAEQGLLPGGRTIPPVLAPNQMQAFRYYYQQSADKLNLVNTVMLESTQQAYVSTVSDIAARIAQTQTILNTETGAVISGVSTYNEAMHDGVQRMVANGLTGFIDHGGHKWSPETYVAMDIRSTLFNTAREAVWERNAEYGNDLYQVSSKAAARPLCYPWQGKIISRTGGGGVYAIGSQAVDMPTGGVLAQGMTAPQAPVGGGGTTTDLYGNTITVHSEDEIESFRYGGGLFGVNCGHYPMVFIPGVSTVTPPPQNEEENAKAYAESQQQRELERKLREERRKLEVLKAQGATDAEIKAQQARVNNASHKIDDFCDETGRARRRSREYTPVNATWPDPQATPGGTATPPASGPSTPTPAARETPGTTPPAAPVAVTRDEASADWFECENARAMKTYSATGHMPTKDMYGNPIPEQQRRKLMAEADLIQREAETTKTEYRRLYRGAVLDEKEIATVYKPGTTYTTDSLTATSPTLNIASIYSNVENYGGGEGKPVIFEFEKPDGLKGFKRDDLETILPKGASFRVSRKWADESGVTHVSLYSGKGKK